jgi:hypothetical protein
LGINVKRKKLNEKAETKFCSKCSYPLKPEAFDEIKKESEVIYKSR